MTTNNKPKVSIIIPIWNTEKYLVKCLNSLVNQTLKEIEIICVNNGSTDSCGQILEDFAKKDDRIKVVNIEHGSISNARNIGLKNATAGYITFVDSDDWVESECYASAVKEFDRDSEIDIVCWGANIFNLDLDENSSYIKGARNYHKIKFTGKLELKDDVIFETNVCVWNKMFKANYIVKNNIIFPEDIELEDNSFFYTYISLCKYAYYINKYFYNYVQRKGSGLEKLQAKQTDIIAPNIKNLIYVANFYANENLLKIKLNLIKKLFVRSARADIYCTREEQYPQLFNKILEVRPLLGNKFMQYFFKSIESKDYQNAIAIINGKYIKLLGNSIFGIYKQEIHSRYQIKFIGIKFKFKLKG